MNIYEEIKRLNWILTSKCKSNIVFGPLPDKGCPNILYVYNGNFYTWNGTTFIPLGVDNYVQSVNNYTELRALEGYVPDVISVRDWEYNGPDGNSYKTYGGIFKKVLTGTENGGTIIVSSDNTIWQREWDGVNVRPEWWECGGYDVYGDPFTNKNTISPVANTVLGSLAVFHAGIYNDRDRIQSAIYIGSSSDAINIEYSGGEYIIDKTLSNYNPIAGEDINGQHNFNFSTIKRTNSPVTTLTSDLLANATEINVDDASNFRVGQNLNVFDPNDTYEGLGFDEAALLTITGILGNTISVLNSTPSKTFSSGSFVMLEVTLYDNRTFTLGTVTYKDGFIDGNNTNNNSQRFSKDWRYNYGILGGTGANFVNFENIEFRDNPSENVTSPAGRMVNCRGYNLNGSFFHYSMNDARYALNLNTGFTIDDCYVDGVCINTDAVSVHCEAAITNSLHTEYVKINNSTFKNGAEYIFALDQGQPDTKCNFIISNSSFENFKAISLAFSAAAPITEREEGLNINNCKFYNCGDLVLGAFGNDNQNNIYKGLSWDQININNNMFVGSRFIFQSTTNLNFNNNQVLFRDELNSTFPDYGRANLDTNPERAAIFLFRSAKVDISNNIIENQYTENVKLLVGIAFPAKYHTVMKDEGNGDLDYFYEQGVSIKGNQILGFHSGILTALSVLDNVNSLGTSIQKSVLGWQISNNQIILSNNKNSSYFGTTTEKHCGISAVMGTIVDNNIIWQTIDNENQCGIWALNHEPWPLTVSSLIGVTIKNNFIYGNSIGFDIEMDNFGQGWGRNGICVNNITKRPIQGTNASRNYLAGNILINNTNLPSLDAPERPTFQTFEWNTGNY